MPEACGARRGAPGQPVILFDYAPTRAASVPMRVLADYKGFLQADGYAGYNKPGRRDGVVQVGCLAHARRKFVHAMRGSAATMRSRHSTPLARPARKALRPKRSP